ncbi:MAG: hypothetical protein H0U77_12520 [Nocardioidaceae bacterium]|nr:hypothetical protein [Nocardioidaceae bacterium]
MANDIGTRRRVPHLIRPVDDDERATRDSVAGRATRTDWRLVAVISAVHMGLMSVVIARHEPWFDEAQAWLLARDASLADLLWTYPRYEGSPVLWHLLLSVPAKLGAPYASLKVLSVICALVANVVFVRFSPFPLLAKIALPLSYWFFFQYGVVARSYALLAPLLFGAAMTWPRRRDHPYRMLAVLVLLANVSIHGFLIAGGLAAVHVVDEARSWAHLSRPRRRGVTVLVGGFAACTAMLFLQLRTPSDHSFLVDTPLDFNPVHVFVEVKGMVKDAFTGGRYTAALVVGASFVWFWKSRALLVWLVPTVAVAMFSSVRYANVWHEGILVLIWVFALWVSLENQDRWRHGGYGRVVRPGVAFAALALVMVLQLRWTVLSTRFDLDHVYSASHALAEYLKAEELTGGVIVGSGLETLSVQPYFEANIFDNYHNGSPAAFWVWSTNTRYPAPAGLLPDAPPGERPDAIIASDKRGGSRRAVAPLSFPGYRLDAHLEGSIYVKEDVFETEGFYVYRPVDSDR